MYTDPVFAESGTWRMSTSHLISEYFDGWGYGNKTVFLSDLHLIMLGAKPGKTQKKTVLLQAR
jgi:hypothetical protein